MAGCVALDAKRAGQIDHANARLDERRRDLSGRALRHREKREVRLFREPFLIKRFNLAVPNPIQAGEGPGCRVRTRRHGGGKANVGVTGEEGNQLLAGVSRRSRDPNSYCL